MPTFKVAMNVDGMIYVKVEAETEEQAAKEAESMCADFVEVVHVAIIEPEDEDA